jgi:hypothetical protein
MASVTRNEQDGSFTVQFGNKEKVLGALASDGRTGVSVSRITFTAEQARQIAEAVAVADESHNPK